MASGVRPNLNHASNGNNEYLRTSSRMSIETSDDGGVPSTAAASVTVGAGGVGVPARKGSKYDKKIGHWRVDDNGQVTYKKKPTSELMAAIQLGISHSVGSLYPKPMRDVLYEDFHVVETHTFPKEGSTQTPAHRWSDFKFKTFAPVAFRYFRELFKIRPDDFLCSLCTRPLTELSNPGASGSIFYITDDDEFIIKTVQHKEADFLQKLLPGYYMNLNQNPCTLLPKFYGLYCYQCGGKNIRFVVMNNVLPSFITLHEKYDLKGSTYKRKASKQEKMKKTPTLKDLDFKELHTEGLCLDAETHQALMRTIDRDCRVLQSFKIMDYSLLLGVHHIQGDTSGSAQTVFYPTESSVKPDVYQRSVSVESQTVVQKPRLAKYSTAMEAIQATTNSQLVGGIPAFDSKTGDRLLLYIGVIDVLQSYRFMKKFEHTLKSIVHDGDSISVHQPGFYAQRFQSFCCNFVFKRHIPQNVRHSPTKRKSLVATSSAAGHVGGHVGGLRKHSVAEATSHKPLSSNSEENVMLGAKPDLLPRPTPPSSHSVSLLDVYTTPLNDVPQRKPMSSSVHSMLSTPSHTDRTDAAISFTTSSPSLASLDTSPMSLLLATSDLNVSGDRLSSTNFNSSHNFDNDDENFLSQQLLEITRL